MGHTTGKLLWHTTDGKHTLIRDPLAVCHMPHIIHGQHSPNFTVWESLNLLSCQCAKGVDATRAERSIGTAEQWGSHSTLNHKPTTPPPPTCSKEAKQKGLDM